MADAVPIVLGLAVVTGAALFRWLPGRDAALVVLIGGWALLPNRVYPASGFLGAGELAGTIHALAIPADSLWNKATAVGLACLAGSILFHWPALRRVRWGPCDLPLAAWCLVPLASATSAGLPAADGLAQVRYQVLVWGVPYLMGRAFLVTSDGLDRLAQGLVLAGLAYTPLCLAEMAAGPFAYALLYGPHPYRFDGAERWLVARPLGLLEHGNQLGTWLALAATAASWLWRSGRLPSYGGIPAGWLAAGLVALAVACQSHGAIGLMAVALVPLARPGPWGLSLVGRVPMRVAAVAAVGLALMLGVVGVGLAQSPAARERLRATFAGAGKSSFTWRLARGEELLPQVARHPWLGGARADWSSGPDGRILDPVALPLWLHAAGLYGVVGVAALAGLLIMPTVRAVRALAVPFRWDSAAPAVFLAGVLLSLGVLDGLMNSVWVVPLTAAAGGLNGWVGRLTAARSDRHKGARSHID